MITQFWEGVGSELARRGAVAALTPAFAFWAGGLAAWTWSHGGPGELTVVVNQVAGLTAALQVALLLGAALVVGTSGIIAQQLTLPAIRLLEGYWPQWSARVRVRLVDRQVARVRGLGRQWDALAPAVHDGTANREEYSRFELLDRRLRRFPTAEVLIMPTRVGNILRSAETRPNDKYGLDAVKCWPQLWLVLPEATRQELVDARADLNAAILAWLWCVLFVVWTPWAPPALVVGVVSSVVTYLVLIVARAELYADVIEAAFDVHRAALYRALRWPLPGTPADERECGRALTRYLWRGSDQPQPQLTDP